MQITHNKDDCGKEELSKYLSFKIGNENYGISILAIKEIIEYGSVTNIQIMTDFIVGAINLRGRTLSIIDLSVKLRNKKQEINKRTGVVVVEMLLNGKRADIGLMVEAVNEVIDINPENIDKPDSLGGNLNTNFLAGMARMDDRFLILLNISNLLNNEDMSLMAQGISPGASE